MNQIESRYEAFAVPGCIAAEAEVEPSTGGQALAGPNTAAAPAAGEVPVGQDIEAPPKKYIRVSASKANSVSHNHFSTPHILCLLKTLCIVRQTPSTPHWTALEDDTPSHPVAHGEEM